jgi:AcrR family transcriptional regulator
MGKPNADSYHKIDLSRTLLDALRQELREHGPEDISLRRIAERAGVSHAAPYRHFNGKDGLLAALCWQGQAEFTSGLARAREGAPAVPAEKLFRLGFAYLDFARNNPEVFRLMFSAAGTRAMAANPPFDCAVAGARYDSFGVLLGTVGECQAAGALDPGEERMTLGLLIWSFVHGLAFISGEHLAGTPEKTAGLNPVAAETAAMKAFRSLVMGKGKVSGKSGNKGSGRATTDKRG